MTPITFQEISAATHRDSEPGRLVWVRDRLVAVLLAAENGWFLQHGLGPIEAEGILFRTIEDAEAWIRESLPPAWLLAGDPRAAPAAAE
jgi:hypothetical protein